GPAAPAPGNKPVHPLLHPEARRSDGATDAHRPAHTLSLQRRGLVLDRKREWPGVQEHSLVISVSHPGDPQDREPALLLQREGGRDLRRRRAAAQTEVALVLRVRPRRRGPIQARDVPAGPKRSSYGWL